MIVNGYELKLNPISNITIFDIEMAFPEPKAPLFMLDDGREIENYHDPVYNHCVMLFSSLKSDTIFMRMLKHIDYDISYLSDVVWRDKWEHIKRSSFIESTDEKVSFLLYHVFQTEKQKEDVVDQIVLTERRVHKFFNAISVVRQGIDIKEAHIRNAIQTGIDSIPVIVGALQIVSPLDEYKVASEAGISWPDWLKGTMSLDDKASAVALYRLDKLIHLHQEDAAQIEAERKQKKG